MAGSALEAIHVSAKVVLSETAVPALGGAPFNRDDKLQKGIHVHWALPDALTRATLLPKGGEDVAVFPGVPDLWLVIRFNPGPPIAQIGAKRTWRAWVVDSVQENSVDLSSVTPPHRDPDVIHTIAGMLPNASGLGYPGYGMVNTKIHDTVDPAIAAYYPSSRHRFGFHDTLSDLAGKTGNVSYVVIGWFADRGYDPLSLADDRFGMVNKWHVLHHTRPNAFAEMGTMAPMKGAKAEPPRFDVKIAVSETPMPTMARQADISRLAERGGSVWSQASKIEVMKSSFPEPPIGSNMPIQASVDAYCSEVGPRDTICHGSVVEVPLGGAKTAPVAIDDKAIRLFPSVRRALAELAAMNVDAADQVDAVEMMLDDLEASKGSVAGVLDMPGIAHSMTFQGVPGKSKWYARLEIHPSAPLMEAAAFFDVAPIAQSGLSSAFWPKMVMRSASEIDAWSIQNIPPVAQYDPAPQLPQGPDDGAKAAFRQQVHDAVAALALAAAGAGTPIEPGLLNVLDKRKDAQPSTIGKTIGNGAGSDGASWWVDIGEPEQVDELLRSIDGAKVYMPHIDNLYEVPGPRWNRPWAPQLVLFGTGRSYKFGFDGRYRADGYMKGRLSGETAIGLSLGTYSRVLGQDLVDKPTQLFSTPGVPPEVRGI